MATFQEIAEEFSRDIRLSLQTDGFTPSGYKSASTVRDSHTAATLKQIDADLDRYTISGRQLTEGERSDILGLTAEALGSSRRDSVGRAVKSASNDSFTDLVDGIDDLLK